MTPARAFAAFALCAVSLAWLLESMPPEYALALAQGLFFAWLVVAVMFAALVMSTEEHGAIKPGRRKR